MKLKFGNGTTVDIRKFTREYAQNQSGRTYLNITSTYESPAVFDRIASTARNADNISHMEITDDNDVRVEPKQRRSVSLRAQK